MSKCTRCLGEVDLETYLNLDLLCPPCFDHEWPRLIREVPIELAEEDVRAVFVRGE